MAVSEPLVIPAKAVISSRKGALPAEVPAFAGMTAFFAPQG
jgi:hypothetical protein